ncbi:hypothetical protein [Teichococcus rhizosphaerae]|nr:hypothetical protein [Pseudoroseomonas rhizosphaerae]
MFIACIDIGKPGANLGWAAVDGDVSSDGTNLDVCVEAVATALQRGPASLGFESPLFLPVRDDPLTLNKARQGESGKGLLSRPFSAPAGSTVAVLGLLIATYVLKRLRKLCPEAVATMDWRNPPTGAGSLLIWEAFITGQAKTHDTRHVEDAQLAIQGYQERMANPAEAVSSVHEPSCLNLVGAALLRTGWTTDVAVLADQCLVVRV